MREVALSLVLLVPLLGAATGLVFLGMARIQKAIALGTAFIHLAVSIALVELVRTGGPIEVQAAGWKAPFGITLYADSASALALVLMGTISVATTLFGFSMAQSRGEERSDYFPLFPVLVLGASGAAVSADLFNLYVWFEVMLAASFALLAFGGKAPQLRASLLYVSLNLLGSAFYLFAVATLYSSFGTLHLGQLSHLLYTEDTLLVRRLAWGFLFVFFLIKLAAFPFFAWLPTAYPKPPMAVTALFSGILTKLGFFVLLRLWSALSPPQIFADVAFWIGALTLVSGVSAALVEREARRMIMWLLAGEMGYLLLALSYWGDDGVAAALYLLLHMSLSINALLLVVGLVEGCHEKVDTRKWYGLMKGSPAISLALGLGALALAGVPPLSGFIAKVGLLRASMARGDSVGVFVVLLAGLLSLSALGWLWMRLSWGERMPARATEGSDRSEGRGPWAVSGACVLLGAMMLIAVAGGWTYDFCVAAATELLKGPSRPGF